MLKVAILSFALLLLILVLAVAWVWRPISATHPAIKNGNLPALIPLREFYANQKGIAGHSISMDGSKLAWIETKRFKRVLKIKDIKTGKISALDTPKGSWLYYWSPNGNSIILNIDREGRELYEIAIRDIDDIDGKWRFFDLGKDAISFINFLPKTASDKIIIANNKRNTGIFDLYNLDLKSGNAEPLGLHHEQQVTLAYDDSGTIIGRTIQGEIGSGDWVFETGNSDENWKQVASGNYTDFLWLFGNKRSDNTMLGISNLNRDTSAVVSFDLSNGNEEVIQQDDRVDTSYVFINPVSNKLLMSNVHTEKVEHTFFDKELEKKLSIIDAKPDAEYSLGAATKDFSKVIVKTIDPVSATTTYLLDLENDKVDLLAKAPLAKYQDRFSSYEGVQIVADDGLKTPAYLYWSKGVSGPAPMIIMVHGGPITRTRGSFETFYAMLNNRGYAVLDVNYRGSWGYGRKFAEAGKGEIAGKMSSDIIDARHWAVEQGIADPDKVGIFGISWGGFEVMTAVTQNSDLFAAAVNINGVADLSTMMTEVPDYWRGWQEWVSEYGADHSTPEGFKYLQDRSPLYHTDKMKTPLLIIQASNDVRVVQSQSERLVAELDKYNAPYEYQLIKDVGHNPTGWPWQKRYLMIRDVEHFFAKHLGGRAGGYDYAILGAHILPE